MSTRTGFISFFLCCAIAFTLSVLSLPAHAQSEAGSISGLVTDPTGAVVRSAQLRLVDIDRNTVREAKSNSTGFYTFANVHPGRFRIEVQELGFKIANITGVIVNTQDSLEENVHLELGSASESVTVEANRINLNMNDGTIGTVVDEQFVKSIPLNGRTFQSLLLLTPGMVFTPNEQGQLSVNGARTDSNYFTVDGVSGNIGVGVQSLYDQSASGSIPGFNSFGGTQNLLSLDAMQEVKIQTSTYSAEYGRQPGAQVSLVSKSGTNSYHGTAYDYLRNSATDANDWFSDNLGVKKIANRQNDFGGTIGGPVRIPYLYNGTDKTFFFFDYEGLKLALPQPTRAFNVPATCLHNNPALNAQLQALVNAFPVPNTNPGSCAAGANGRGTFTTGYDNYTNMNTFALRLDQSFGTRWSAFARLDHSKSQAETYNLGQLTHWPFYTDTATVGLTTQIRNTMSNSVRLNFSKDVAESNISWTTKFGGQPIPNIYTTDFLPAGAPSYAVPYFPIGGQSYEVGPYTYHRTADWNAVENLQWQRGRHSLVFGADLRWVKPLYNDNGYVYQISFSTLPNILANKGSGALIQSLPVEAQVGNYSFYGNDSWRISNRFTLSYGLRWDINPAPSLGQYSLPAFTGFPDVTSLKLAPAGTEYYPTFMREFAPRVGFAYQLRGGAEKATLVRGGWGLFYDLGTGTTLATSHSFPFSQTQSIPLLPFPFAAGTVQNVTLPVAVSSPYSSTGFTGLQHLDGLPRTQQYSLTIEQQLGKDQLLSVNYVGAHGQRLLERYQYKFLNPTANIAKNDTFFFTRNDGQAGGFSYYNGLQVNYVRNMSHGLQVLANYTWSHALDAFSNDSTINGSEVPNSAANEIAAGFYGTSDFDRRQIFNLATVYAIPKLHSDRTALSWLEKSFTNGWETSYNFKYQSGTPFTMGFSYYDVTNGTGFSSLIANRVPGQPLYIPDPTNPGGTAFNPAAFAIPAADLQPDQSLIVNGNAGRNSLTGPGLSQLDLAVRRNFPITERVNLQFSAEVFNVLNHPNFLNPDGSLGYVFNSPTYGPSACPGNPKGISCDFNYPNPRNGPHTAFFTSGTFGELNRLADGVAAGSGPGSRFDISLNPRYALGGPRSAQFSLRLSF